MRKHRRNVLRHLRTAEFDKLTKKGERLLAEAERIDREEGVTVYEIETDEDFERMLDGISQVFYEVIKEKKRNRG